MLKNLEILGCLHVSEDKKEKMENSIVSVIDMMKTISNVEIKENLTVIEKSTNLRDDNVVLENTLNTQNNTTGIYTEDGLFLAPKTIKK